MPAAVVVAELGQPKRYRRLDVARVLVVCRALVDAVERSLDREVGEVVSAATWSEIAVDVEAARVVIGQVLLGVTLGGLDDAMEGINRGSTVS